MDFPNIDPVALQIGPFAIRWYALAYLAGFMIGWRYALYLAGKIDGFKPTRTQIDDFLVWAIPGVILGGRIGYVLFYNFEYYSEYPLQALKVWEGGMSFHGGALGMIFAMIMYASIHKIPLFRLTDIICCTVPIGLFFGRLANFANGELFGRVTNVSWGVIFPHGGPEPRHPSQIYEAFFEGLVLFVILYLLARADYLNRYSGMISGMFLFLYGVFRFGIEYTREPDAQLGLIIGDLSMGQILCLPMIIVGLLIMWKARTLNGSTTAAR